LPLEVREKYQDHRRQAQKITAQKRLTARQARRLTKGNRHEMARKQAQESAVNTLQLFVKAKEELREVKTQPSIRRGRKKYWSDLTLAERKQLSALWRNN